MAGGFPVNQSLCNGVSYGATFVAGTDGILITAGSTANLKGAWTQITAATTIDTSALGVALNLVNGYNGQSGLDIGIGAGGAEVAIVSNLVVPGGGNTVSNTTSILMPLTIPAGTRIAARSQSTAINKVMGMGLQLFDGSIIAHEAAGVDAVGFTGTTTSGTALTAGSRVKGTYAQLTAATARDYMGFFIAVDGAAAAGGTGHNIWFDIAIGTGGGELIIVPDWVFAPWAGLFNAYISSFFPIEIPAGTRIAARGAHEQASTVALGITVYGVYQ